MKLSLKRNKPYSTPVSLRRRSPLQKGDLWRRERKTNSRRGEARKIRRPEGDLLKATQKQRKNLKGALLEHASSRRMETNMKGGRRELKEKGKREKIEGLASKRAAL